MSKETGRKTGKNEKKEHVHEKPLTHKYYHGEMEFDGKKYPLVSAESVPGLQDLIGASYDKQKLEKRSKPLRRIKAKGFPKAMEFNLDERAPKNTIGVYKTRIK